MAPAPARRSYTPRLPREERRELLLDAALRLIDECGYAGVSMEAVAREADIAKTVVYEVFKTKERMLKALLAREQEVVLEAIAAAVPSPPLEGDPAQILADALRRALGSISEHPQTWRLILLPADGTPLPVRDEVRRHRERLVGQIEPMAGWGLEQMGLTGLDTELVAFTILSVVEDAARLTLTDPDRFPPDRLADFALSLLGAISKS